MLFQWSETQKRWPFSTRLTLRSLLLVTAAVALVFLIVRQRALSEGYATRTLLALGCDLKFQSLVGASPPLTSATHDITFCCLNNVTTVTVYDLAKLEMVVRQIETLGTVETVELCVGGTCALSWASGHAAKEKLREQLPDVTIKVTGSAIPIVG